MLRGIRNGFLFLVLGLGAVIAQAANPRVIIMSDIGGTEPDDQESFVRLLLYANELDLVGLIGANSRFGANRGDLAAFQHIIDVYAGVRSNLLAHASGYPTASYLTSILREGQKGIVGMAGVGDTRTTPGSQLIIEELKKADARPLWVLAWGGSSTLAQALWDLEREGLPSAERDALVAKLRVYEVAGQDDCGAWLAHQYPDLFIIRSGNQFMSFSYRASWQGQPQQDGDLSVVGFNWFLNNVRANHGAYGAAYPNAVYMYEGDTPSFLYLLDNGLHDPEAPSQGSWGGRFTRTKQAPPDVYENSIDNRYAPAPMYLNDSDRYDFEGTTYETIFTPLWRWRYEYQNDFAARVDWTLTSDFTAVNHEPSAVVNGDTSTDVLHLEAVPGEVVELDAAGSSDPDDGDTLAYHWWVYPEAGTYGAPVTVATPDAPTLRFTMPADAAEGETIHLLLSLRDDGAPALTSYRRIILTAGTEVPPPPAKVLFLGNSFTIGATRSVPAIFDALARAGGQPDPTTVMRAVGGQDFEFHAQDAGSQAAITSDDWTHVILQNYSTEPTHYVSSSHSLADHFTFGAQLYDQVMAHRPGAEVILYETWSRSAAHAMISGTSGPTSFATTAEMQGELRANYRALAEQLNAAHPSNPPVRVAPAGDAWENVGALLPASDPDFVHLHGGDEYHANDNGYYLNAAVFYSVIYGASPVGLSSAPEVVALGLDFTEDPTLLEQAAWETVLATPPPGERVHLDFGAAENPTTTTGWNNVDPSTTNLSGLVDQAGNPTALGLEVLVAFNAANTDGSTGSTRFPAEASSDSLFGNTEVFNGQENVFPAFKLTGLAADRRYHLTFYASRTGVSDDRQTRYTVTGANVVVVDLDPSENVDTSITASGIVADASGEVTVTLAPGPANDSPNHFTYLGVLEIDAIAYTPLSFTREPSSLTVSENAAVTLIAEVEGTPPWAVQWYADGQPISGAHALSYSIPSAPAALDGTAYHVTVSDGSIELTSQAAILTVVADETPPTLDGATVAGDGGSIDLVFSEAVDPASATDPASFTVQCEDTRIPVATATLSPDGRTATLTLGVPAFGTYSIRVDGTVTDLSGNPIDPGTSLSGALPDRAGAVLRFDFGSTSTPTDPSDDNGVVWNNVDSIGTSDTGVLTGLLTEAGAATPYALEMVARFNNANSSGTTGSGVFPSEATRDSLFGNTEAWGGLTNLFPAFKLTGLDPSLTYALTFYASRTGVSDRRETVYTVTGAQTQVASLEPAQNQDAVATATGLVPDAADALTIEIAPGPANDNAYHFTYLGVLVLETSRPDLPAPVFTTVEGQEGGIQLDWTGEAYLEFSDDLDGVWTAVVPPATPPVTLAVPDGQPARFFRLRRP